MMLPKLNFDSKLKRRTPGVQGQVTEEGQPGSYSPRIPSSHAPKLSAGTGGDGRLSSAGTAANTAVSTASSSACSPAPSISGAALPSPHSSPHEVSLVGDGLVGISDPEVTSLLAAKSRHSSADRSPSSDRSSANGNSPGFASGSSPGKRRASPLATLVDHQQARQALPTPASSATDSDAVVAGTKASKAAASDVGDAATAAAAAATAASSSAPPSPAAAAATAKRRTGFALTSPRQSSTKGRATPSSFTTTSTPSATAAPATAPSAAITTITAEEVYISGKPFHEYMSAYGARTSAPAAPSESASRSGGPTATAAAGAHITTTFHQNPSQYISSMASQGDFVALGDRTGRVVVMRRREMAATARRTLLETIRRSEEAEEEKVAGKAVTTSPTSVSSSTPSRPVALLNQAQDPFTFHVDQQAYVPVIDTLNNVEIAPNVTALAFLPQSTPATLLLTANEKVPKLYKIMSVRDSANAFRAVDKIGTKTIGPLTASSRASTVAMKPVARYAMNHEFSIRSICPIAYSDQFATADESTVLLWCTEYPDTSIETPVLVPRDEGSSREYIWSVRTFPHEPFLVFVTTTTGMLRVLDTRQTLRWGLQSAQVFSNPLRDEDAPHDFVTNNIYDTALSPSGRYIAGRDFMSVCLWDVRMAGKAPSSPRRAAATHRSGSGGGDQGGDGAVMRRWELCPELRPDLESCFQSDLMFESLSLQFLSSNQVCTGGFNNTLYTVNVESTSADSSADIRTFQLPKTEGISDFRRTTVSARAPGEDRVITVQDLGSRLTFLSRPTMSMSGACGMMVASGQALLQLSYTGASA